MPHSLHHLCFWGEVHTSKRHKEREHFPFLYCFHWLSAIFSSSLFLLPLRISAPFLCTCNHFPQRCFTFTENDYFIYKSQCVRDGRDSQVMKEGREGDKRSKEGDGLAQDHSAN